MNVGDTSQASRAQKKLIESLTFLQLEKRDRKDQTKTTVGIYIFIPKDFSLQ
jgi:hypothetical protein